MSLSDRIREVPPCSKCAPSGGIRACDGEGNALPGRCDCLKGRLLAKSDAMRAKRDFTVPLYGATNQRREVQTMTR
jgi:hypothetical protein